MGVSDSLWQSQESIWKHFHALSSISKIFPRLSDRLRRLWSCCSRIGPATHPHIDIRRRLIVPGSWRGLPSPFRQGDMAWRCRWVFAGPDKSLKYSKEKRPKVLMMCHVSMSQFSKTPTVKMAGECPLCGVCDCCPPSPMWFSLVTLAAARSAVRKYGSLRMVTGVRFWE